MERVGILISRLQEQLSQKVDINNMIVTAQLLQNELLLQRGETKTAGSKKVAVIVPHSLITTISHSGVEDEEILNTFKPGIKEHSNQQFATAAGKPVEPAPAELVEQVMEPIIEKLPEPEPIPHFEEEKPWKNLFIDKEEKGATWHLDSVMDIPTLAHQEKVVFELNDVMVAENGASINDKLKQENDEVASKLQDTPVKDLKKAISINDRHRFIHELFRDDETMYERSIKTINGFHIFAEAEYWIQRELKVKLGWDTTLELVRIFDQVVKRRFS